MFLNKVMLFEYRDQGGFFKDQDQSTFQGSRLLFKIKSLFKGVWGASPKDRGGDFFLGRGIHFIDFGGCFVMITIKSHFY